MFLQRCFSDVKNYSHFFAVYAIIPVVLRYYLKRLFHAGEGALWCVNGRGVLNKYKKYVLQVTKTAVSTLYIMDGSGWDRRD